MKNDYGRNNGCSESFYSRPNHSLPQRPVKRQVNVRGQFQISQCSTLGDRLDDFGCQKRQPDQAGYIAISNALAAGNRDQRSRAAGDEFLEPPMGVIDWVKATIADPAFDYGAVIAILATVPIHGPPGLHLTLRALMNNLATAHSRPCRSLPESEAALRYYQVFDCVVQLSNVARSRAQGKTAHGVYNSPVGVANLINHMRRLTGLKVDLSV
jgi:hypothetical protein